MQIWCSIVNATSCVPDRSDMETDMHFVESNRGQFNAIARHLRARGERQKRAREAKFLNETI